MWGSEEEGGWLNECVKWKIGCGLRVKFWEDRWREEGLSSMEKYQRLYCISQQQHHNIQQMGVEVGELSEWNFESWRMMLEGEMKLVVSFIEDIEEFRVQPNQQDKWIWKRDVSGLCTQWEVNIVCLVKLCRMRKKTGHSHLSGK